MFKKLLICSDGSRSALQAAECGADVAARYGAEVIIVTVFDPSRVHVPFTGIVGGPIDTMYDEGRYAEDVRLSIEKLTSEVVERAGVTYRTRCELGHPVERIVAAACDEGADLIVLGRRGLSTFQSLRLGSVSEGVLHQAHCPVLVIQ